METTKHFYEAYQEARTRLQLVLETITESDLSKKLVPSPNSVGFLMRHIGDVELLFSKNVFKLEEVHVKAQTVIDQKDTGEWTNLIELTDYLNQANKTVLSAIAQQEDDSWDETITTKEFGTKMKAEAFGRIISHTAYHAGQLALFAKYGSVV
ncbi:MAG: DinB family protein [Fluviicola sp.]|nr:DinB family protein [Fluviicola sp.]